MSNIKLLNTYNVIIPVDSSNKNKFNKFEFVPVYHIRHTTYWYVLLQANIQYKINLYYLYAPQVYERVVSAQYQCIVF